MHWAQGSAIDRVGTYWHMLPEAAQARKAIWDAVDPHRGQKRIDLAFPKELRRRTRDQEMQIEFINGSTWQVLGSDNYDSLVGSPPVGVTFSEYALADPKSWSMLRPILAENGGWAIFISTPRGRNHLHRLYEMARKTPGWFGEVLSVDKTGVFTPEQIQRERAEQAAEMGDEEADSMIQQEYFCDFDAPVIGTYFAAMISKAEQEGRITEVPWDPRVPVWTAWDIGVGDSTAIWFIQHAGLEVRVIDYYEISGKGADHFAKVLTERGYTYAGHYWPHDGDNREWGANASSRQATAKSLGIKPIKILPRASVDDGINAGRLLITRCRFDRGKCEEGLDALRNYKKIWDDKLRRFSDKPLHDWSSNGADAWRYLAQGIKDPVKPGTQQHEYAIM